MFILLLLSCPFSPSLRTLLALSSCSALVAVVFMPFPSVPREVALRLLTARPGRSFPFPPALRLPLALLPFILPLSLSGLLPHRVVSPPLPLFMRFSHVCSAAFTALEILARKGTLRCPDVVAPHTSRIPGTVRPLFFLSPTACRADPLPIAALRAATLGRLGRAKTLQGQCGAADTRGPQDRVSLRDVLPSATCHRFGRLTRPALSPLI